MHIATDHAGYAEWIDALLGQQPGLENLYAPQPFRPAAPGRTTTTYEAEWRALGRSLHFFCYEKASTVRAIRSGPGRIQAGAVNCRQGRNNSMRDGEVEADPPDAPRSPRGSATRRR